jgi:hypothetical protein
MMSARTTELIDELMSNSDDAREHTDVHSIILPFDSFDAFANVDVPQLRAELRLPPDRLDHLLALYRTPQTHTILQLLNDDDNNVDSHHHHHHHHHHHMSILKTGCLQIDSV